MIVENNFLSPNDRDIRDKALEDQKAGRNLKEASQNIIYLSDKDAYTDRLVALYSKGELDKKGQLELTEYLNAVGIQLQLRGLSESDAKIRIENILKYPGGFKDTRSAYYEALGQLSTEERHAWQAVIGTDALLAGPGRASQLMRLALIPVGGEQIVKGIGQIADGKFTEGTINTGLGGLILSGGFLGNKVTAGKPNGGIVSPSNHIWQENTFVKYPFYDKPQQGGTLNIGAGNKPIEGAYNISHPDYPKGTGVYAGDANNLSNIATGSQKTIIMENPYGFKPFNNEVLRVLDKNGTIIVKGSWSNPIIRKIENEAKKHGFILTEKKCYSKYWFFTD